ncbi:hypothetical protein DFH94DRAFT_780276 [Russula ochroleuca]|uniref:Uncharacterized protein n=1 Tax=Russula ochroleuca TaxID=152965 RepID=A0A9P5JX55_9AGAM|nr:hypothetical protein DFH94DRAFT_780276 [Russula ochroleuca]
MSVGLQHGHVHVGIQRASARPVSKVKVRKSEVIVGVDDIHRGPPQGRARERRSGVLERTRGRVLARRLRMDGGEGVDLGVGVMGEDVVKHPRARGRPAWAWASSVDVVILQGACVCTCVSRAHAGACEWVSSACEGVRVRAGTQCASAWAWAARARGRARARTKAISEGK